MFGTHAGITKFTMVISAIEMTAVTASVNPASFALPSTRSVNSVENTVVFNAGYGVSFSWSWLEAGDDNVFCVYINYEKTEDPDVDPGVTDEIQQKIDDAVNKAFSDMGSGDSYL